jgi:hypothetical protein
MEHEAIQLMDALDPRAAAAQRAASSSSAAPHAHVPADATVD